MGVRVGSGWASLCRSAHSTEVEPDGPSYGDGSAAPAAAKATAMRACVRRRLCARVCGCGCVCLCAGAGKGGGKGEPAPPCGALSPVSTCAVMSGLWAPTGGGSDA